MDCYLTSWRGETWLMPQALSWELEHGMGSPCDAFEICFLYEKNMQEMLAAATRFRAVHEGETVFCGVVDEYEIRADSKGLTVTVRGRGLAALLLDNEAESAEYYNPGTDFILDKHVFPWGVDEVRRGAEIRTGLFSVSGGSSQWRVLEDFFWFCGGIRPRFSKEGVLLLDGSVGKLLHIDGSTAVAEQVFTAARCGVISEVLVRHLSGGAERVVENEVFKAEGGNCRRVVHVPRRTDYQAMRHTGEYQIRRSQLGSRVCRLRLPELFAAFPGDRVILSDSPAGIRGTFTVSRSRCWACGETAGTELELEQEGE